MGWENEGGHRRSWTAVWTDHDPAVAAGYKVDAQRWRLLFDELMLIVRRRLQAGAAPMIRSPSTTTTPVDNCPPTELREGGRFRGPQ